MSFLIKEIAHTAPSNRVINVNEQSLSWTNLVDVIHVARAQPYVTFSVFFDEFSDCKVKVFWRNVWQNV